MSKTLSIIIPTFNESENVEKCYNEVKKELIKISKYKHEILFLDNRSEDDTFQKIKLICAKDKNVKSYRYANNFGIQKSILFGYSIAKGDAVIQIDCDLQDSPELISKFIEKWEKGYDVVYGIRKKRSDGFILNLLIKGYYFILNKISNHNIPTNAGDFRLVTKKIINNLLLIENNDLYLRGAIAKIGFNQIGIEYSRKKRLAGKSKFNFISYINFAFTGITQNSSAPLRLILYLGILIMFLSIFLIIYYLFEKFFLGNEVSGFATLVCLILFSMGINSIMIGVVGEYLSRVYSQTRTIERVIIDEEVNTIKSK